MKHFSEMDHLLQIDELSGNDAEYIKLKDEIDELRGKAVEAKKLESTVEMYKRKLGKALHGLGDCGSC